jgi:uncharacterized membrane protein
MNRVPMLSFVVLLIAVGAYIATTTASLPVRVATHFGAGDLANGWMSRTGYLAFMLTFATLLPIAVVGLVGWLPRVAPGSVNVPHRDLWMAPARRAATLEALGRYACALGCVFVAFIAGVHRLLLEANAAVPPRLPAGPLWVLVAAFLAALALWIAVLWMRFRAPPR